MSYHLAPWLMNKTITQALHDATKLLSKNLIESARLDARLILQFCCNLTFEQIIANSDQLIDCTNFEQLILKRANRMPVDQIIGYREFYGINFEISQHTLSPRPDSETLIEAALNYYSDQNAKLSILDLGTGSGCLILTLLSQFPNANGLAVDICPDAIAIAKKNATKLNLDSRIRFSCSSWADNINEKFDLIIANPPYISLTEFEQLEPEVKIYEPRLALTDNDDGLSCYHAICGYLPNIMTDNSVALFEIGHSQAEDVSHIIQQAGLKVINSFADLANITRCLAITK